MKTDWVQVFESPSLAEVHFIQGMLKEQGIESVVVNKQDSLHIHLNNFMEVQLFVPAEDAVTARHQIQKHT